MTKEQLKKDLTQALKNGEPLKRLVLGMLLTAIQNREIAKRTQLSKTTKELFELESESKLTEEEIMGVIAKEIKKRKDAIELYKTGGRPELAEKENQEVEILSTYLSV